MSEDSGRNESRPESPQRLPSHAAGPGGTTAVGPGRPTWDGRARGGAQGPATGGGRVQRPRSQEPAARVDVLARPLPASAGEGWV